MTILMQDKRGLVNYENIQYLRITVDKEDFDDEELNYSTITAFIDNDWIELGNYENLERAKEILMDMYSKLADDKKVYKMPEE